PIKAPGKRERDDMKRRANVERAGQRSHFCFLPISAPSPDFCFLLPAMPTDAQLRRVMPIVPQKSYTAPSPVCRGVEAAASDAPTTERLRASDLSPAIEPSDDAAHSFVNAPPPVKQVGNLRYD